jgi:hypothetical protein
MMLGKPSAALSRPEPQSIDDDDDDDDMMMMMMMMLQTH